MLALTPGLFGAALMAAAIPARVLSLESMVIGAETPPTESVSVPVPMATAEFATGVEDRLAAVARFCTSREYVAGIAPEVADAVATVVSATVAVRPARVLGLSRVVSVACSVSSALLKVP